MIVAIDGPAGSGKSTVAHEIARRRGMLLSGGVADTELAAIMLLDEFRGGKIGRITLERPEEKV